MENEDSSVMDRFEAEMREIQDAVMRYFGANPLADEPLQFDDLRSHVDWASGDEDVDVFMATIIARESLWSLRGPREG